ncbi:unnamed protein product [Auanema sp. JU1783]|nr:unnamed protein product [Auanema sp. JU1783]
MSVGAAFPLELLYSEIVNYCKESEERRNVAKTQWNKIAESCTDSPSLESYTSLVQQAFAHNNCETQLESIGFRIGYVIAEKLAKDSGRLFSELEIVKFICKEFWCAAFGKQVDNLRTNHQGVYVVQDNKFSSLSCFSEGTQFVKESALYLAIPSGIIRGALSNLNVQAVVTPTVETLPSVKFHIHIQQR